MSTHKHFDKICCVVLVLTLILTFLFMNASHFGIEKSVSAAGYESRLFDTSSVHTIDIVMEDWDSFISTCTSEEYASCTVVIDGEAYKNVAIRAKGNTSLTQVASYGNDRYSFKLEFDHYDSTRTYYGLDKLCLNNVIQDNTYIKDYLTFQMMAEMGVASPLCSYANISVNGETWGLYLAVESIEESFLQRNYGTDYGELYKPDSMSMGGGRGNGKDFEMNEWDESGGENKGTAKDAASDSDYTQGRDMHFKTMQGGHKDEMAQGSSDVLLQYTDDAFDSYPNIFDNAKTEVSDSDKERLIDALKNLSSGENLADTVNIERVIRYFVVHNFVLNFDSYTGSMIHNYYLYEKDGQLEMLPWDYNLAFGGFQSAGSSTNLVNYPIDSPISGGSAEDRPMIAWIFASEEYTELYHQYFAEFISQYFGSGEFAEMIDSVKALISPYVKEDPTSFCTYEEFVTGIDTLKEFCLLRAESISGQLDGTIGSTSETQSQDTLIDAGDLNISDMGSMNSSMGERDKNNRILPQSENEAPAATDNTDTALQPQDEEAPPDGPSMQNGEPPSDGPSMQEGETPPNGPSMQEGETPPDGGQMRDGSHRLEGNSDAGGAAPADTDPRQTAVSSASSWMLIGLSAGILILGLGFACFFKRRRSLS